MGVNIYDYRLDVDHCCCRYDDFAAGDVVDVSVQVNLLIVQMDRNQIVGLHAQCILRLQED